MYIHDGRLLTLEETSVVFLYPLRREEPATATLGKEGTMLRKVQLFAVSVATIVVCATCAQDSGQTVTVEDAKKPDESCVEPAQGPIEASASKAPSAMQGASQMQFARGSVRPGDVAPDFEAAAFLDGSFKNVKLSDYRGKWVVLCFYPGDFTFV